MPSQSGFFVVKYANIVVNKYKNKIHEIFAKTSVLFNFTRSNGIPACVFIFSKRVF